MAKKAIPTSDNFNFTVEQVRLHTPEGKPTDFFGTRRTDTGDVLGSVSEHYGIVQNGDAINVVEDAFTKESLGAFTRKVTVTNGGGGLFATYDFANRNIVVPKVNDILGLRLTLLNSFDGSSPLAFQVGYLRLVCTNGMKSVVKELALTKKHYGTISLDFVRQRLAEAITKANNSVQLFANMAEIALSQNDGLHIIANLVAQGKISKAIGDAIAGIWNKPTYREDSARNLYNLYNAFTQHASRVVEKERFELARRITATVTGTFASVTQHRNELAALVLPPPVKSASGVIIAP